MEGGHHESHLGGEETETQEAKKTEREQGLSFQVTFPVKSPPIGSFALVSITSNNAVR